MNHLPLFAGINGFGLAADWMGWNQTAHCEIDEFCQKVIQYYWPKSIPHYDIKETDFKQYKGTVNIISGGFPCQPYSVAGKRKGKDDDRHLWPEMLRAIREIQPRWIVGENVRGLINWNGGLVFDEVQTDLENQGYEVLPFILPAAAVNAPHRRDRIWFVAFKNTLCRGQLFRELKEKRTEIWQQRNACSKSSNGVYLRKRPTTNTNGTSIEIKSITRQEKGQFIGQNCRKHESSRFETFPTQSPVCSRNDGFSSRLDGITFPKWRNESIKAAGNAIVPQVAHEIFKIIQQIESEL